MLRRHSTVISLSSRDIRDHLDHIYQQRKQRYEDIQPTRDRFSLTPLFDSICTSTCEGNDAGHMGSSLTDTFGPISVLDTNTSSTDLRSSYRPAFAIGDPVEIRNTGQGSDNVDDEELSLPSILPRKTGVLKQQHISSDSEEQYILFSLTDSSDLNVETRIFQEPQEEEKQKAQHEDQDRPPCPYKYSFDYGGFTEQPTIATLYGSLKPASPSKKSLLPICKIHHRISLSQSRLFHPCETASSQTSLTCSLNTQIATYESHGSLFAQLARRPKVYRRRTLSYSFEEPESLNATCEGTLGLNNDFISSLQCLTECKSLHEGLRESSLQSLSAAINIPFSPQASPTSSQRSASVSSRIEILSVNQRAIHLSTPGLPIPPPFSAIARSTSVHASIPIAEEEHPLLKVRSVSTPRQTNGIPEFADTLIATVAVTRGEEQLSLLPRATRGNQATLPSQCPYRPRSPMQSWREISDSQSTTSRKPRQTGQDEFMLFSPRVELRIYNDGINAAVQPQTPDQLPESRHRSRHHLVQTAPAVPRVNASHQGRTRTGGHRGTRSGSPAGMDLPGFRGLYGGYENTDDEISFQQTRRRLWNLTPGLRSDISGDSTSGN